MGNPHRSTPIPPSGPALIEALKVLHTMLPAKMELFEHQTSILWSKYCMCRDKGFTEQQAIFLCTQNWDNAL